MRDKSVDVAAAFQAFHWFDARRAFQELSRISRRRIGLVQYERDETAPFSKAYGEIVRRYAMDDTEQLRLRTLERFSELAGSELRRSEAAFAQPLDLPGVLGRVDSSSYLPQNGTAGGAAAVRGTSPVRGFRSERHRRDAHDGPYFNRPPLPSARHPRVPVI